MHTVLLIASSAHLRFPFVLQWNTPANLENGIDDPKDVSRLYDHLHEPDGKPYSRPPRCVANVLTFLFPVTIFQLQGDVVGMHGRLTVREHCKLAVSYRRILLSHRAELQASAQPGNEGVCSRASIVNEMHRVCAEFLETISRRLLPVSKTGEEIVYCWTMSVFSRRRVVVCLPAERFLSGLQISIV